MKSFKKIVRSGVNIIMDKRYRNSIFSSLGLFDKMSDEKYLNMRYENVMGKELNIENPQTFNEKLQWLKLYDRRPEYTVMVDKYLVRDYIAKKIGEEYLIPLLGVWDNPEDIDFDTLPNQFVLKCNHNSGLGMCICKDKSKLDIKKVKAELKKGIKQDYYLSGREWPYKNVPRKIIAEKYMSDSQSEDLRDYKFYNFNGKPLFLYLSQGLADHDTASINYLTLDWEKADFKRCDYKEFDALPNKPVNFDKMIELSQKLSEDIPFVRTDFYEINGQVYFGELTFFPGSGFTAFRPDEWDKKIGEWLEIPEKIGGGVRINK